MIAKYIRRWNEGPYGFYLRHAQESDGTYTGSRKDVHLETAEDRDEDEELHRAIERTDEEKLTATNFSQK